uniref:FHA domain-containing protein n=1 Tax=Neolamprologus brichardi TaxID=32507 RepID=A0A3Q4G1J4_NEOBR
MFVFSVEPGIGIDLDRRQNYDSIVTAGSASISCCIYLGRAWGKLVKVDSSETVLLFNSECTVGRKKGCYLSFPANKLVSGEHCKIVKDESSGLVWLEDMSTNGTVINMSKLVKKQTHMLQNGDVIYFVYRKSEPEQSEF